MGTEGRRHRASTHQTPGVAAVKGRLAFCLILALVPGGGIAPAFSSPAPFASKVSPSALRDPFITVQGTTPPPLPSLVLPPDAAAGPPMFASLMRQGDSAMLRGNIIQARSYYERAATLYRASSAAPLAVGKTFDPNVLSSLGASSSFADPAVAREWYRHARALGDSAAAELLARLP